MKKMLVLFAALALSVSASAGKVKFGADVGPAVGLNDGIGIGFTVGANGFYPLGPGEIGASVHYSSFAAEDILGITPDNWTAIDFVANYKYGFGGGGSVKPYGIGGLGFRRGSISITIPGFGLIPAQTVSADATDLLIEVGGGADIAVGSMTMFFEAVYQASGNIDSLPIKVGMRF